MILLETQSDSAKLMKREHWVDTGRLLACYRHTGRLPQCVSPRCTTLKMVARICQAMLARRGVLLFIGVIEVYCRIDASMPY